MGEKPRCSVRPRFDDYQDLDVTIEEAGSYRRDVLVLLAAILRDHSTTGAIAIVTLIVLAVGFCTVDNVWGLLAIDALIIVFAILVILLERNRGQRHEEAPPCPNEPRNEPQGSPET